MFIKTSLWLDLLHEDHWASLGCCVLLSVRPVTGYRSGHCLVTPRTWPGLASHVQGSPAQTGRNTNSKMVRNQKSVSQNLKDPYIFLVPSEGPLPTGQPLLHVSGLPRCGPYDTRYHSRQTHTKWHNINFHREPALARLNSSLMSQYMSISTN